MHVAVVADFVASTVYVSHEVLMSLGDVAWDVEAGRYVVAVEEVEDPGRRDGGAVLAHGHEAGEVGGVGVSVDRTGYAVDVESEHHYAPGVAGPYAAHWGPPIVSYGLGEGYRIARSLSAFAVIY